MANVPANNPDASLEATPPSADTSVKKTEPAPAGGISDKLTGAVESVKGAVEKVPAAMSEVQEKCVNAIREGKGVIRNAVAGSGSITQELKGVGKSYLEMAKTTLTAAPTALGQLVTLHPIKAVTTTTEGSFKILGELIKVATSPARLVVAGGSQLLGLTRAIVGIPGAAIRTVAGSPRLAINWVNSSIMTLDSALFGKEESADKASKEASLPPPPSGVETDMARGSV